MMNLSGKTGRFWRFAATIAAALAVIAAANESDPGEDPDPPPIINTYTLSYEAAEFGKLQIDGEDAAVNPHVTEVEEGEIGPVVTAVPYDGYHFVKWSDDLEDPVRADIAEEDLAVKAIFAVNTYDLTYAAGDNGKLQINNADAANPYIISAAEHFSQSPKITAVPAEGYDFAGWSDGITAAERPSATVVGPISVSALFLPSVIKIASYADLNKIGRDPLYPLHWKYELSAHIDASASAVGAGFEPIGRRLSGGIEIQRFAFSGNFDGKGFEVRDLHINLPTAVADEVSVGLFGYTHGANIKNLGVVSANVIGNRHTGALVGRAHSTTIENCYSSGTVSGGHDIGGLIGRSEKSTVKLSYSSAAVSGAMYVGGFIGSSARTDISESYALGTVTATVSGIGGFVGLMEDGGRIEYCYALGAVNGSARTGGFVGEQSSASPPATIDAGQIRMCYSVGAVSGATNSIGGFAGNAVIDIAFCRFNSDNNPGLPSTTGATGMTAANMMTAAEYDWGFAESAAWGHSNHYPYLKRLPTHTLTFTAAPGGMVFGAAEAAQIFNAGINTDIRAVAALSESGGTFSGWYAAGTEQKLTVGQNTGFSVVGFSADSMTLTLTSVTADAAIEARFELKKFALKYSVQTVGGKILITGHNNDVPVDNAVIPVTYGTTGPSVAAIPDFGYRFQRWDGEFVDPETETDSVRADIADADMEIAARFSPQNYMLKYIAGSGGRLLVNDTAKILPHNTNRLPFGTVGPSVEALPDSGYEFVKWSDGDTNRIRRDTVWPNFEVTAEFTKSVSVLTPDRSIPQYKPDVDAFAIIPVSPMGFKFSAGPNPAVKSTGMMGFFVNARPIGNVIGALTIYDAGGNVVRKININSPAVDQQVAIWDLRNTGGHLVPSGTYLIRGTLTVGGKREKVSAVIGVR